MENLFVFVAEFKNKRNLERIEQELKNIFEAATTKISEKYNAIAINDDWIKNNEPAAYKGISDIEDRLNIIWKNCLTGSDDIENFRAIVNDFVNTYMRVIEKFSLQRSNDNKVLSAETI